LERKCRDIFFAVVCAQEFLIMGKRILVQRAGKGTQNFRSRKHRKRGRVKYIPYSDKLITGTVIDFIHEGGRGVPLALMEYEDGRRVLWLPPEGIFVGDSFDIGPKTDIKIGNTMSLGNIPEGTLVYNIEIQPGDGGKMCRASGTTAQIMTRTAKGVQVLFPSQKRKTFRPEARATIGVVAGGGRTTRPFVKAGAKWHYMKTKPTKWPRVTASSMNACSHPFGGGRKRTAGTSTTTSRNAPPGRKVGLIAARQSGRETR
jgi:large subunit ribosomal protein L2